jgi:glycosyltransferase involved in cell wall biosynthesis
MVRSSMPIGCARARQKRRTPFGNRYSGCLRVEDPPRVSVLMPTFNSPIGWLRDAIDSVRAQSYPHWELCIADDASTDPQVRTTLEQYAARDGRIRLEFRSETGHISRATNSALALATGDWVAFLDHDDRLAPNALAWLMIEAHMLPDARLIYSDEDQVDGEGAEATALLQARLVATARDQSGLPRASGGDPSRTCGKRLRS